MSPYKVSIIVPVFGVEMFIERCVRALMEQTLDSIEYIFVNDATQDDSIAIISRVVSEYPERASGVTIIDHPVNKGLPIARKTGLSVSQGEFIIHCDSDDYVEKDMCELMYRKACETGCDIVVSGYYEGNPENWRDFSGHGESLDLMDNLFSLKCAVWNKMIRSSIAKDPSIITPKVNMAEDLALMVQYALLTDKVSYVEKPLYHYDRHSTSILGRRNPDDLINKQAQYVENCNIAIAAIKSKGQYGKYADVILHQCLYIKNYILPALAFTDSYKLWKNTYSEINHRVLFSKMFTCREKLNFIITFLGLYPLYYKISRTNG